VTKEHNHTVAYRRIERESDFDREREAEWNDRKNEHGKAECTKESRHFGQARSRQGNLSHEYEDHEQDGWYELHQKFVTPCFVQNSAKN
jgi:hypothetical protein